VKNWIFDDPFLKKLLVLVIFVPVMIRTSGSFFGRLLKPVRLKRLLRSMRLERFLRPGKSLLWTSESFRFLDSIISGLILLDFDDFEKNHCFTES
jgi:hypothetical protein